MITACMRLFVGASRLLSWFRTILRWGEHHSGGALLMNDHAIRVGIAAKLMRSRISCCRSIEIPDPRRGGRRLICALLVVAQLLLGTTSIVGSMWASSGGARTTSPSTRATTSVHEGCKSRFIAYKSSPLEQWWMDHVGDNDGRAERFCPQVVKHQRSIRSWLGTTQTVGSAKSFDTQVFSMFTHEVTCGNEPPRMETTYIEPLATALRHPFAGCLRGGKGARETILKWNMKGQPKTNIHALEEKNYLLLQCQQEKRISNGKLMLFDLGASTWDEGIGGSSQEWFWKNYQQCGYSIERMLLWEAKTLSTEDIYRPVPKGAHHAYQYFNIPASADRNDPSNPLNIVKRVASPEDFVAIKLDIDFAELEMQFVDQMLTDPGLDGLIDELFFEHHVAFPPFVKCCWDDTYDKGATLKTSYELFLRFREQGIRMHGWP